MISVDANMLEEQFDLGLFKGGRRGGALSACFLLYRFCGKPGLQENGLLLPLGF